MAQIQMEPEKENVLVSKHSLIVLVILDVSLVFSDIFVIWYGGNCCSCSDVLGCFLVATSF